MNLISPLAALALVVGWTLPASAAEPEDWDCVSSTEFRLVKMIDDPAYTEATAHTRGQSYELFGNATHDYDGQVYTSGVRKFRGCLGYGQGWPEQVEVYVTYKLVSNGPDKVKTAEWCDWSQPAQPCKYPATL